LARNDVDVSVDAVIARSAQRDEAISVTRMELDGPKGHAAFWRNEPEDWFWRNEPETPTPPLAATRHVGFLPPLARSALSRRTG
jgi:hypothetical protein